MKTLDAFNLRMYVLARRHISAPTATFLMVVTFGFLLSMSAVTP